MIFMYIGTCDQRAYYRYRRMLPHERQVEELLAALLNPDPTQRPTAMQMLRHPAMSRVTAELHMLGLLAPQLGD